MDKIRRALDTKTAAVTTAAVSSLSDFGFSAQDLQAARRATISTVTNNLMVTWSGVDPTSTLGHPVVASADWAVVEGVSDVVRVKLLALTGSATVTVTLEK